MINIGCSFVQNEYLISSENGSSQTDQLPLSHTQIAPSLTHLRVQSTTQLSHSFSQLDTVQSAPEIRLSVFVKGVQIVAKSALKKDRFLWNDGNGFSQWVDVDGGSVHPIDDY